MAGATGAMTGFAFPEILVADREALERRRARRRGRRVLPRRAADALRVPGRDRHGDPQGSAAPPRRAGERGDARARRRARRADQAALDRVLDVGHDRRKAWNGSRSEGQGRDGRRREPRARLRRRGGAGARRRDGLDLVEQPGVDRRGREADLVRRGDRPRHGRGRPQRPITSPRWAAEDDRALRRRRSAVHQRRRPAGRRRDRRSTTRRGRTRSTCCCSARCAWCARRCRR